MTAIDWLLLAAYLVLTLVLGLWLARHNSGEADYFVAGRRLNGWLAGASMAATTFSIDTPPVSYTHLTLPTNSGV